MSTHQQAAPSPVITTKLVSVRMMERDLVGIVGMLDRLGRSEAAPSALQRERCHELEMLLRDALAAARVRIPAGVS